MSNTTLTTQEIEARYTECKEAVEEYLSTEEFFYLDMLVGIASYLETDIIEQIKERLEEEYEDNAVALDAISVIENLLEERAE